MSPPIPLALLICDHAWRDPRTGKHHILGTFSGLNSARFPTATSLTVYFALTEGRGKLPVRMQLVDVDEERPVVFDVEGIFEARYIREVIEGTFVFNNIVFPLPGEYRLKLLVGGEFLMAQTQRRTCGIRHELTCWQPSIPTRRAAIPISDRRAGAQGDCRPVAGGRRCASGWERCARRPCRRC